VGAGVVWAVVVRAVVVWAVVVAAECCKELCHLQSSECKISLGNGDYPEKSF